MIRLKKETERLVLIYEAEASNPNWVTEKLEETGSVPIKRAFQFDATSHITEVVPETEASIDEYEYKFLLGVSDDGYYRIAASKLRVEHDVLIDQNANIDAKWFLTHRGIAIFPKIDALVEGEVIIGGERSGAIPIEEFERLLKQFPGTTELNHYQASKIGRILREYFDLKSDPEMKFEKYLNSRSLGGDIRKSSGLLKLEKHKFTFVRDRIQQLLDEDQNYSEAEWQNLMLEFILVLFPKYVYVLRKVKVRDFYAPSGRVTRREIDLALVDATGNLDIIEIKKPFCDCLVSKGNYRDNFTPRRELSGTVIQAEKYLFHLNKWGMEGERKITEAQRKKGTIPQDVSIMITNPKAMVIAGRSNNLTNQQLFDFEIMKRHYANVMDIMSYDDLLARLKRMIDRFTSI